MTEDEIKAAAEAEAKAQAEKEAADKAALEAKKAEDEKNKLSDTEAKAIKELMKWKEKAKLMEAEKAELEKKYGSVDLDAAKEALRKAEEAERKELEKKGEYERLLAKQREQAQAEIEAARKRAEEFEKKLTDTLGAVNELSLSNAFANSKFIQEQLTLTPTKTKALYGSHFDIEEGKLIAYDKPKGTPDRTPLVDALGRNVSFEDAITQIINADPDKDTLLKDHRKAGAGSKGNQADHRKIDSPLDSVSKIAKGLSNPKNFGPANPHG